MTDLVGLAPVRGPHSGDPGSCGKRTTNEMFNRGETLVMPEQPKPQPKPERPEKDKRVEGARAALQMSMDRRY